MSDIFDKYIAAALERDRLKALLEEKDRKIQTLEVQIQDITNFSGAPYAQQELRTIREVLGMKGGVDTASVAMAALVKSDKIGTPQEGRAFSALLSGVDLKMSTSHSGKNGVALLCLNGIWLDVNIPIKGEGDLASAWNAAKSILAEDGADNFEARCRAHWG